MAEVNFVAESFKFMLLGMGVVFLFLLILVQVVKLQAYLVNKYFPESTSTQAPVTPVANRSDKDEKQRVAAIIAAITEFRKNKS